MGDDDVRPKVQPSESLADLLARLKTPTPGTSRALQEAADKTARTGRSLADLFDALKTPTFPATHVSAVAVPDVQTRIAQIDLDDLPAARTARATEDMADRLGDYQADVARMVTLLQAQADEQRERAERAERQQHRSYRLTQISVAVAVLATIATIVLPFVI